MRRTVVGLLALAASIVAVLVVVSTWGGGRAGTTSAPVLEPRRHVVLPALGHTDGFTSTCHATLASEFLADPSAAPATTCVAAMAGPAFVLP